jgi:hypothetical protein
VSFATDSAMAALSFATDSAVAGLLAAHAAGPGGERRIGGADGPLVRPVTFGERLGVVARAARDESPPAAVAGGLLVTALLEPGAGAWSEDVERRAEIVVLALAGAEAEAPPFALTRALAVRAGLDPRRVDAMAAAEVDRIAVEAGRSGADADLDRAIDATTTFRRIVLVDTPARGLDAIRDELADRLLRRASVETPPLRLATASTASPPDDPRLAGAPDAGASGSPVAAAWPDAPPWPDPRLARQTSASFATANAAPSAPPRAAEPLGPEIRDGGGVPGFTPDGARPPAAAWPDPRSWPGRPPASRTFASPAIATAAPSALLRAAESLAPESRDGGGDTDLAPGGAPPVSSGAWPRVAIASPRRDPGLAADLRTRATLNPRAADQDACVPHASRPLAPPPPVAGSPLMPPAPVAAPGLRPPALRAADLADALAALLEAEADLRGLD